MSMREALFGDYPIPDDTRHVAQAAFPKGNLYLQLRDRFGMLYTNQRFAHLFAPAGKPALAPARLALVLCLQFIEDLSDEQVADAVRDRISWKYLLGLPLDDPGFDASVLSEFRKRLLKDDATALLLDAVLELCRDAGLLKARSKQRTDSTYVLANIRDLSRLENVAETLRHALNQLAVEAPDWLGAHAEAAWVERYGRRITEYRLPQADAERQALVETIGQDGYRLLEAIYHPASPTELRDLPAVQTLRQVWVQQYYRCDDPSAPVLRWRTRDEQPPSAQIISSPYDPEARCKTKRNTTWIGYAVHLTETCEDDTPNLITQVTTTSSSVDDHTMLAPIQADLAARDMVPSEHYVDSGYVDAQALVDSQRQQIRLVGPMQADGSWQARTPNGITNAQFVLDWDAQQAVCPEGKLSRTWQACTDGHGNAGIVVVFAQKDCLNCGRRPECTRGQKQGRQLMLRPREQHLALLSARAWQETADFKAQYARRAGVEGTFTQANRRGDLRHARYIGVAKTHLQNVIIAVALNLLRVLAWLGEVPRATTRTSPFARLMMASP
jgi:transposase